MKSYKRMVASLLAMLMLVGVLPLADLRADEAEETDAEVAIEETSEETEETDEIIFEEPAEVEEFFEEISEEVVEVEETEEVEEVAEELPAEEIVVEPEEDLATGVEGFINRIYSVALGRTPDAGGRTYWINQINRGKTGADVARNFLFSSEFLNKNMTNSQFLDVIYRVFFDRDADASGKQFYLNKLASGWTKQQVINAFIDSTEWANICQRYGIASGSRATPTLIRDFVTRLYTSCLNRSADPSGLSYYVNLLTNHTLTGTEAAQRFFFSQEMLNSSISNEQFIRRLYRTCFNREADDAGFRYWRNKMNEDGWFREDVFNSFISSNEWRSICENSGILVGSPIAVHHSTYATWADIEGAWEDPTDNGWHYVNVESVTFTLTNDFAFDHYYKIYRGAELIYTSGIEHGNNCSVILDSNHGVSINTFYLSTGRYTVNCYAADGTVVYSSYCDVDSFAGRWMNPDTVFNQRFEYYTLWAARNSTYGYNGVLNASDEHLHYCITTEPTIAKRMSVYYQLYYYETLEEMNASLDSPSAVDLVDSGWSDPAYMGPAGEILHYYYQIDFEEPYTPGFYVMYIYDDESEVASNHFVSRERLYIADA